MKIRKTSFLVFISIMFLPFFYQWTGMSLQAQPGLVWAKQFKGGGTNNRGHAVTLDKSGNIYTVGFYNGTMDFDPGPGTYNLTTSGGSAIFVSKLNASGDFVMAKQFTGTAVTDGGLPYAVSVSDNGDIYITGQFTSTVDFDPGAGTFNMTSPGPSNHLDGFVCKLDASGNFLWAVKIGNSDNDVANNLAIDKNGNVYVTGYFRDMVDFDPGPGTYNLNSVSTSSIFVLKLNTSGNFVWAKFMGDSIPPYGSSVGYSIALDGSGNVYTTGQFTTMCDFDPGPGTYFLTPAVVGNLEMFISKLDNNGNFVWAKNAGPIAAQTLNAGHNYIAIDGSKHIYIAGAFSGTVDFDPGAGVSNLTSTGSSDVYISKFDSSGNFVWARKIGASTYASVPAIALDTKANIFMTGLFKGTADFDPGSGSFNLTSAGNQDMYINELDSSGNFVCAGQIGGTSTSTDLCNGWGIIVDGNSAVYVTGQFLGNVDFDPGASVTNIDGNAGRIFVGKYSPCNVSTTLTVDITTQDATCGSTDGTATATPAGGTSPYTYRWSTTPQQTTQSATGLAAGTYSVTITDAVSNLLVKQAVINGSQSDTASVTISASATSICTGSPVTFSATPDNGGSAPSYQWKINGNNAGTNSPVFTNSTLNDNDVVTCVMTSNAACVTGSPATSNSITISTNGAFAGTISAQRDTICSGTPGFLNVSGNTGTIQWQSSATQSSFSDIAGAVSNSYSNVFAQTTYFRVYTSSGSSCSDTSTVFKLVVMPSPVAEFTYTVAGRQVTFNSSGSSDDVTIFSWNFGDNQTSTTPNPVHTYPSDTIFHTCLTVNNGSNCSYTVCKDINLITGIHSISQDSRWKIYPNPVSNTILIEKNFSEQIQQIGVYDILGRVLISKTTEKQINPVEINCSGLSSGMYLLKIKAGNENFVRRFIKQ